MSETINDTVAAIHRGADGRVRLIGDVCRFGFLSPHGWYCYNQDFLTAQFEETATDDDTVADDDLDDDTTSDDDADDDLADDDAGDDDDDDADDDDGADDDADDDAGPDDDATADDDDNDDSGGCV